MQVRPGRSDLHYQLSIAYEKNNPFFFNQDFIYQYFKRTIHHFGQNQSDGFFPEPAV